jgi:hypothetical protein
MKHWRLLLEAAPNSKGVAPQHFLDLHKRLQKPRVKDEKVLKREKHEIPCEKIYTRNQTLKL